MRYAWDPAFFAGEQLGLAEPPLPLLVGRLRRQDAIARPGPCCPRTRVVAARIRKYYRRDSTVILPSAIAFLGAARDDGYYLFLGRLVPTSAPISPWRPCARLDRPLKVAGAERGGEALAGWPARVPSCSASSRTTRSRCRRGARFSSGRRTSGWCHVEVQAAGVPVVALTAAGRRTAWSTASPASCTRSPGSRGCARRSSAESTSFDEQVLRERAAAFSPGARP